jgi:hypothetical protein
LFAAVYPPIAEHTGYSIPEVHEVCKQMFLPGRTMSIGDNMKGARFNRTAMNDHVVCKACA